MTRATRIHVACALLALGTSLSACGVSPADFGQVTVRGDGPIAAASYAVASAGDAQFTDFDDLDDVQDEAAAAAPAEGPARHMQRTITQTNKDGSVTVRQYNPDGSVQITRKKGDQLVMQEDYSAPAPAQATYKVPSGAQTQLVTLKVVREPNGSTGGGQIFRSFLNKKLVGMQSTVTLTDPAGEKAMRARLAEAYSGNRPGHTQVQTHTKRGDYVMDCTRDAEGVIKGIGKLTKPDGVTQDIQTVQNPDKSHERTSTDSGTHQREDLRWNADKSGQGWIQDVSVNPPKQLATMTWDSMGKGTITYASGEAKAFKP